MSFKSYKDKIDEGDTVILYLSNNIYALDVFPEIKNRKGDMVENVFQTPFGALKVKSLIGVEYGSRVELSRGWGHVLQPTPELWSLTLPHRTQIIYTPDISMILFQLDLVPGNVVVEAGTGSGSLTHALIRRVKPHGHVYTFDFHELRAKVAKEEFESHGISEYVTVKHRDVLEDGFGEELNGKADAVFLDLPSPWNGVQHAVKIIKEDGGRFCSFSPCIEQVQRTCLTLQEHGFQEISTMEVLQTELKVSKRTVPVRDLSFLKYKLMRNGTSGNSPPAISPASASECPMTSGPNQPHIANERSSEKPVEEKPSSETSYVVASWPNSTPGHTGYLTFATLPPSHECGNSNSLKTESKEESQIANNGEVAENN